MEPGTSDLDDARRALRHRIDGHRAALRTAEALGWPGILRASIAETEARLDEACACLLAVDLATLPERPSLAERVALANNRSDTDPTWRTDYRDE